MIHFEHENSSARSFQIEIDPDGTGNWSVYDTVSIAGKSSSTSGGYGYFVLPEAVDAQWVRVRTTQSTNSLTTYFHLGSDSNTRHAGMVQSLAAIGQPTARSQGVLRTSTASDFPLQFAADILDANGTITDTGFYRVQLNSDLNIEIVSVNDASAEADLRSSAATTQDFGIDAASVYIDDGGTRYRLPFGNNAYSTDSASGPRRGIREVVTERSLMNIHGTIYELPRDNSGGIARIRPITTHNLDIYDFTSWRGMLVLSGVDADSAEDGHYLESQDGKVGLWLGNVDDLWSFGAPVGVGGPWLDTAVNSGTTSDPFLMYGYDQKLLEISHTDTEDVTFTIQVDFLGTGQWETFGDVTVEADQTLAYFFPEDYSAHWVRLISGESTTVTAQFTYSLLEQFLAGDLNGDGFVGAIDLDILLANWGQSVTPGLLIAGDATGDGQVGDNDLNVVLSNWGSGTEPGANIPEPGSALALSGLLLLCLPRRRSKSKSNQR